jgi:hypothetical protein
LKIIPSEARYKSYSRRRAARFLRQVSITNFIHNFSEYIKIVLIILKLKFWCDSNMNYIDHLNVISQLLLYLHKYAVCEII